MSKLLWEERKNIYIWTDIFLLHNLKKWFVMIVKIDKRETARVCDAVKQYMPRYKIIIEKLEVGDFIFKENRKEVVFEYKTHLNMLRFRLLFTSSYKKNTI